MLTGHLPSHWSLQRSVGLSDIDRTRRWFSVSRKDYLHMDIDLDTKWETSVQRYGRNRRDAEKHSQLFHPINKRFNEKMDCQTYCFADYSSRYDEERAWRLSTRAKWLQVRLELQTLKLFPPISIINFLLVSNLACNGNGDNTNGEHKWAAVWLLNIFMKCPSPAVLSPGITFLSMWPMHQKEGTVALYCEFVNYLWETYKTGEVIDQNDIDMIRFTQASNKSTGKYSEPFLNKTLRKDRVYDEEVLKGISIEGPPKLIPTI